MIREEPDWISDDAINLRAFLQSPTGHKLVDMLTCRRPGFLNDEAEPGASFARSRSIHGYEQALGEIFSLSSPDPADAIPAPPPGKYPDLDDDSKWPLPP